MDKEQRQRINVLSGIQRNMRNKKWKCILDGCTEEAINSHLLQQHGVLSEICDAGHHFYEVRTTDASSWTETDPPISFKRVGIKEAISLSLFCNKHDTELFSAIEKETVDFDDYTNQLLFCLRTSYSEIRKKETVNELYRRMCGSNILALPQDKIKQLNDLIHLNELGIDDVKSDIAIIQQEINNPSNRIKFIHRVFDRHEVYATAIVSYDPTISNPRDPQVKLDTFFFNLIPFNNKLHVLIGYDSVDTNDSIVNYADVWRKVEEKDLGRLLTGLFVSKIENWGMSVNLYNHLTDANRKMFINIFSAKMEEWPEQLIIDFDLFEGLF